MIEHVEASLSNDSGDVWRVRLALTVEHLAGTGGIEDAAVSKVELISEVPDGGYALEYYYRKPVYRRVRVKDGRLVAPESV